jgi:hypothetical protein
MCCDVVVAQINYPNLNKQDSIEQIRGRSHEESSVQVFMMYDMQLGGIVKWSMLCYSKQKEAINVKSKKTKIYQEKQILVARKRPPTKIRTDHGNETSIYTLNIYLFLCWLINRSVV